MEKTMAEIMEMHSKISPDPWSAARIARENLEHAEANVLLEENKRLANLWYSKDSNNRLDRFLLIQSQECGMLDDLQKDSIPRSPQGAREVNCKFERMLCMTTQNFRSIEYREQKFKDKIRNNNESMENTMGKYLEKEKNESLYQNRYSQYLRENDPHLRKLASQLREAYVNKIRLGQIDEKEKNKNNIAISDLPYVRALEKRIKEDEEKERMELFQEEERKYKLRKLLKQQMKEKEEFRELNAEGEEDKVRIEAIIKANIDEIIVEKEKEFEKKMALRKDFHDFMQEKEQELRRKKQKIKEEESKLHAYSEFTDGRKNELLRLKKLKEENLDDVQKKLGELLNKKQKDIEEFEEARQDVAIAQAEMRAFRFDKDEREAKEKAKHIYIAELDKCTELSQQALQESKMKNMDLDKEIARVNDLKADLEKERQLKKNEINLIFKKECQEDMNYKRLEKEKCLEEEKEQTKLYHMDNQKYDEDVEKERINMIKEMAPHLYPGCIPRGMIKENEIQYLEDPLKNFLLNKKSYPDSDLC